MLQHYALDVTTHIIHAFTSERTRADFCRADRLRRSEFSDNLALGEFMHGWDLLLHEETHVPNYWREFVAWDIEPTTDPGTYRAFADVDHIDV